MTEQSFCNNMLLSNALNRLSVKTASRVVVLFSLNVYFVVRIHKHVSHFTVYCSIQHKIDQHKICCICTDNGPGEFVDKASSLLATLT